MYFHEFINVFDVVSLAVMVYWLTATTNCFIHAMFNRYAILYSLHSGRMAIQYLLNCDNIRTKVDVIMKHFSGSLLAMRNFGQTIDSHHNLIFQCSDLIRLNNRQIHPLKFIFDI